MTANESYAGQVDRYVIALEEAYDKAETAGAVDDVEILRDLLRNAREELRDSANDKQRHG